jgi:glucose-6-phosphate isomerase
MFGLWDWVGGRYSVGSAVGLSLMIAIGPAAFHDFLAGQRTVDEHYLTAPPAENLPMLLGLLTVWYRNFFGWPTRAILPYSQRLDRFPAYLQQLDMESNGKSVRVDGESVAAVTGPVVWGAQGTNGQHAFFQLLHQGTDPIPADFIGFHEPAHDIGSHHDQLVANLFAQTEALAFGRTAAEAHAAGVPDAQVAHRVFAGNRPTTTIMAPSLTPSVLGQLVALYEHEVFTQGVIWGINSFDQWGVELGKDLAGTIFDELTATPGTALQHDSSTNRLIERYRLARGRG